MKIVEKIKTHISCSVTFFLKLCRLWDNVGKFFRAGQATDDIMAHIHCILDNHSYKFTPRICNIYWFSTATVVVQTQLNVALCVHCPPPSLSLSPSRSLSLSLSLSLSFSVSFLSIFLIGAQKLRDMPSKFHVRLIFIIFGTKNSASYCMHVL